MYVTNENEHIKNDYIHSLSSTLFNGTIVMVIEGQGHLLNQDQSSIFIYFLYSLA